MNQRLLLPLFLSFGVAACGTTDDSTSRSIGGVTPEAASFDGAKLDEARFAHYGAGVHEGVVTPVQEILADPKVYASMPVRVKGPIDSVCAKKGCWVVVGTPDQNMLVRFKDYGFFVPVDAAGEIVLEGDVAVEEISVADRKHLLEDADKHAEAAKITEPEVKVTFTAVGAAIAKTR